MKTIGKFIIAGGIGFVVDFSLLSLMLRIGLDPITGRLISFSIAVISTFLINRNYTFKSEGNIFKQFQKYLFASLFGLSVNWGIYSLSLPYFSPQLSLIIASALAMIINFVFYRFVVFKQ